MKNKITLSLVIPVFNEEKRLYKTIEALSQGFHFDGIKLQEVIFVNDGSTDSTKIQLRVAKPKLEKILKSHIRIISYRPNRGKGFAVRTGMLASKADYTLMMDADISTSLKELKKFIPSLKNNEQVIIGTRKNGKAKITQAQPLYRQVLGHCFTVLSQFMLDTWVSDFTCGFKVFHRTAKQAIFTEAVIERWGYDAEILFLANKLGFEIKEVTVAWSDEKGSRVSIIRDSINSLNELLQIRMNALNGTYHLPLQTGFIHTIREALS